MRIKVDLDNWSRIKTYNIFSNYTDPYTGVVTKIDVTNIVKISKNEDISFYCLIVYSILKTMINIDEFKYGYVKENDIYNIYYFDNIAATMTVLNKYNELTFTRYVKYNSNIEEFINEFIKAKNDAYNDIEYYKINGLDECNKINITCMPWIHFSNFKDAINHSEKNSKPKICWGKYYCNEEHYFIDFSILVNHAFQDGYHIGCFINEFQKNLNKLSISNKLKIKKKVKL